jgi:hypothetical protein
MTIADSCCCTTCAAATYELSVDLLQPLRIVAAFDLLAQAI